MFSSILFYFISFIIFYLTYYTTTTIPHIWYDIQGISFEPYGSVAYLEQLRNRISDFEFLLVMGHISMECSMDLDYFPKEPSSAVYLLNKEEVRVLVMLETLKNLIYTCNSLLWICLFDGVRKVLFTSYFYHYFMYNFLTKFQTLLHAH
jgi:hypothetical protein